MKIKNNPYSLKISRKRILSFIIMLAMLLPAISGMLASGDDDNMQLELLWNKPPANANNSVVYPNSRSLVLTPALNEPNSVTALLFFSLPQGKAAEANEIEIRVPVYIFERREQVNPSNAADPEYRYIVNSTAATPTADSSRGQHSIWFGEDSKSSTGFYYEIEATTGENGVTIYEYVIKNWRRITSEDQLNAMFDYTYIPHLIKDGYENLNITASAKYTPQSSDKLEKDTEPLSVKVNTYVRAPSSFDAHRTTSVTDGKYENWQTGWGGRPEDKTTGSLISDSKYFYVIYQMRYQTNDYHSTQPYDLTFDFDYEGTNMFATGAIPGTLITTKNVRDSEGKIIEVIIERESINGTLMGVSGVNNTTTNNTLVQGTGFTSASGIPQVNSSFPLTIRVTPGVSSNSTRHYYRSFLIAYPIPPASEDPDITVTYEVQFTGSATASGIDHPTEPKYPAEWNERDEDGNLIIQNTPSPLVYPDALSEDNPGGRQTWTVPNPISVTADVPKYNHARVGTSLLYEYQPIRFTSPGGYYSLNKNPVGVTSNANPVPGNNYITMHSAITRLEDSDILNPVTLPLMRTAGETYSFGMSAGTRGYHLTAAKREDWAKDPVTGKELPNGPYNYYHRPYKTEVIDGMMWITDTAYANGERLQPGDYSITSTYLTYTEYIHDVDPNTGGAIGLASTDFTGTGAGIPVSLQKDVPAMAYSPVEVWYKDLYSNGEWKKAGEVTRANAANAIGAGTVAGAYSFKSFDGVSKLQYPAGTATVPTNAVAGVLGEFNQIILPSTGVYEIKYVHQSRRYQVDITARFKADIHSTSHVLGLIAGKETARLVNINTMVVTNDDGVIQNQRPYGSLYSPAATSNVTPAEPLKKQVMAEDYELYDTVFTNYQTYLNNIDYKNIWNATTTNPAYIGYVAADTGMMHYVSYIDMTRASRGTTISKSPAAVVDHGATQVNPIEEQSSVQTVMLYEYISYNPEMFDKGTTRDQWLDTLAEWGLFRQQKEGTFYDLLPPGTTVDWDTLNVTTYYNDPLTGNSNATYAAHANEANAANRLQTDFEWYIVDNWQNSGRTMLIVNAKLPVTDEETEERLSRNYQLYQADTGTVYDPPARLWDIETNKGKTGYEPGTIPKIPTSATVSTLTANNLTTEATNANFNAWLPWKNNQIYPQYGTNSWSTDRPFRRIEPVVGYETIRSGFILTYRLITTYETIFDRSGTDGYFRAPNYVAYRAAEGRLNGGTTPPTASPWNSNVNTGLNNSGTPTSTTAPQIYTVFQSLESVPGVPDSGNKNTVYATTTTNFKSPTATLYGISKQVRAQDSPEFGEHAETVPGGIYMYQLRLQGSQSSSHEDVIFYDVLEQNDCDWRGTFVSVDVSNAKTKVAKSGTTSPLNPVVYYSTVDRDLLIPLNPLPGGQAEKNMPYADLNAVIGGEIIDEVLVGGTRIWSTTPPDDLSTVTAIAVDMSKKVDGTPYIFEKGDSAFVIVNMRAPTSYYADYLTSDKDITVYYDETDVKIDTTIYVKDGNGIVGETYDSDSVPDASFKIVRGKAIIGEYVDIEIEETVGSVTSLYDTVTGKIIDIETEDIVIEGLKTGEKIVKIVLEQKPEAGNVLGYFTTDRLLGGNPVYTGKISKPAFATIREIEFAITKSSNPSSGTASNARAVDRSDEIYYTTTIKNLDVIPATKIIVEDTIPPGVELPMIPDDEGGFTLNISEIKFYSGTNAGAAQSVTGATGNGKVKLIGWSGSAEDGWTLIYEIDEMTAKQSINIVVPTIVEDDIPYGTRLESSAKITGINQAEYDIESNTTYHQVYPKIKLDAKVFFEKKNLKAGDFNFVVEIKDIEIDPSYDASCQCPEIKCDDEDCEGDCGICYKCECPEDDCHCNDGTGEGDVGKVVASGTHDLKEDKDDEDLKDFNYLYGDVDFNALDFRKPGVYTYTVRQPEGPQPSVGKIIYDLTEYTVVITVTQDADGEMDATVEVYLGDDEIGIDDIIFHNIFEAPPVYVQVTGKKELAGLGLKTGDFEFEVKDGSTVIQTYSYDAPYAPLTSLTNSDTGISFRLEFTDECEYNYTISEIVDTTPSGDETDVRVSTWKQDTEYDDAIFTISGEIYRNWTTGLLSPRALPLISDEDENETKMLFNNEFTPAPIQVRLDPGTVTLTGGKKIENESFGFTLTAKTPERSPVPELDGVEIKNGVPYLSDGILTGSFDFMKEFEKLEFTAEDIGTHVYEVKQKIPAVGLDGVTYDEKTVTVTVTIGKDMDTGMLTSETKYSVGTSTVPSIAFENVFTPEPVEILLNATVEFHGGELEKEQFRFDAHEILPGEWSEDDYSSRLSNGDPEEPEGGGEKYAGLTFKKLIYTAPGIYRYQVSQINPDREDWGDIDYDEEEYTVVIEIGQDDDTGELFIDSVTITRKDGSVYYEQEEYDPDIDEIGEMLFINRKLNDVTFMWNDGKTPDKYETVEKIKYTETLGEIDEMPEEPETRCPGYVFLGWTTQPELVKIVDGKEVPLDYDDKITGSNVYVKGTYGTENPIRGSEVAFDENTPVTEGMTVYAQWGRERYTVRYHPGERDLWDPDVEFIYEDEFYYDDDTPYPWRDELEEEYHSGRLPHPGDYENDEEGLWYFMEWSPIPDKITGNVTYYARWVLEPKYTVTFLPGDYGTWIEEGINEYPKYPKEEIRAVDVLIAAVVDVASAEAALEAIEALFEKVSGEALTDYDAVKVKVLAAIKKAENEIYIRTENIVEKLENGLISIEDIEEVIDDLKASRNDIVNIFDSNCDEKYMYGVYYGDPTPNLTPTPIESDIIGEPGYKFTGWRIEGVVKDSEDDLFPYVKPNVEAEHIRYVAQWEKIEYKVIFDGNGYDELDTDGVYKPATVNYDKALDDEMPEKPTRTGYNFVGWSIDPNATVPDFDKDTVISGLYPDAIDDVEVTVYAIWEQIDYTVTFEPGEHGHESWIVGGTADEKYVFSRNYGDVTPMPLESDIIGEPGYRFTGWFPVVAETVEDDDNIVYIAQWEPIEYTVVFYRGTQGTWNEITDPGYTVNKKIDGATGEPTPLYYGDDTPAPPDILPHEPGWEFNGWSPVMTATIEGGNEENVIIYVAQWKEIIYTVTYAHGNNGTFTNVIHNDLFYGDPTPEPPDDEYLTGNPGWTFAGWEAQFIEEHFYPDTYVPENEDDDPDIRPVVQGSVIYTAKWTQDEYTVTYLPGDFGGWEDDEKVFTGLIYGSAAPIPNEPDKTEVPGKPGYTFEKWDITVTDPVTGSATYTAQWTQDEYTVTYLPGDFGDWGNGDYVTTDLHYDDATPTPPAVLNGTAALSTNPRWFFAGWTPVWSSTVTGDIIYEAQWTQETQYKIVYDPGETEEGKKGGDWDAEDKTYYKYWGEETPVPPENPQSEEDGWEFDGWDIEISDTVTGNATYTAKWKLKEYTVIFKDGYGDNTTLKEKPVNHGYDATAPTDPSRPGWRFTGWDKDFTNVTGDMTVTAQWAKIEYTVTYNTGSVEVFDYQITTELFYEDGTPDFRGLIQEMADRINPGWTFTGWDAQFIDEHFYPDTYIPENEDDDPDIRPLVLGSVVYVAQWTQDEYTVTYLPGDFGDWDDEDYVTGGLIYGDDTPEPPEPTGEPGYTFIGWSPVWSDTVTGNVTYTALWKEDGKFIVSYYPGEGGDFEPEHYEVDENGPTPEPPYDEYDIPSKHGWRFIGWDKEIEETVTDDIIYTAQWERIEYTVTYLPGEHGEWTDEGIHTGLYYGDPTPLPPSTDNVTDESGDEYVFDGWDIIWSGSVTDDATYTALWRKIYTFNVTFIDEESGEIYKFEVVEEGGDATAPPDPTKTGWTFAGWDKDFTELTEITESITVKAIWEKNVYKVTFKTGYGGNAVISEQDVEHGGGVTPPTDPSRPGYTFKGWDKNFTEITDNTTVTATWTQNTTYTPPEDLPGFVKDPETNPSEPETEPVTEPETKTESETEPTIESILATEPETNPTEPETEPPKESESVTDSETEPETLSTEPVIAPEPETDTDTPTESQSEPVIDAPTESDTQPSSTESTPTQPAIESKQETDPEKERTGPFIPGQIEAQIHGHEDYEELSDHSIPLSNGMFAVGLGEDWWEIFDENGDLIGVFHMVLPDGIEGYTDKDITELTEIARVLENGWFLVELGDNWYQIFDENGHPLEILRLTDGENIDYLDLEYIINNLIFIKNGLPATSNLILRDNPETSDNLGIIIIIMLSGMVIAGLSIWAVSKKGRGKKSKMIL